MLVLGIGDKLQGNASSALKVDYVLSGLIDNALAPISSGQLPLATGDLFEALAITTVKTVTLVNTDSVTRTVNLCYLPSGGVKRCLIAQDMELAAGHSLHTDFEKVSIVSEVGALVFGYIAHSIASHEDTTATGAELDTLTNGSDADALHAHAVNDAKVSNVLTSTEIEAATGKTTPVDADDIGITDSAAANVLKKLTWANLKATLKTYFDTLYPTKADLDTAKATQVRVTYATDDLVDGSEAGKLVEFSKATAQTAILTASEWSAEEWFNWRVIGDGTLTFSSDVNVYSLNLALDSAGKYAGGTVSFDGTDFYITGGLA